MAQSPTEILDVLRKLQALDDEIRDIRTLRETRMERLERLRKVLDHMNRELDDKRGKLTEAEKWQTTKAAELEAERDKLNKAKGKLSGVTRSREYVAVNKELDTIRKNIATREDEVANLIKAVGEFREAIDGQEAKFGDLRKEAQLEERANVEQLTAMDAKIAEVDQRRAAISSGLDKAVVDRYHKIGKARDGRAVVPVKDGSCGGCHMLLQPRFVEMVLRGSSIVMCPHCSRYLYADKVIDPNGQVAAL
jgi:predicted  nucleic acid-binding Zn-ribbon protein